MTLPDGVIILGVVIIISGVLWDLHRAKHVAGGEQASTLELRATEVQPDTAGELLIERTAKKKSKKKPNSQ